MKAVIFDMDGTLLDFEMLSHEALNVPLKERFGNKYEFTWEFHAKNVGRRARGQDSWAQVAIDTFGIPRDKLSEEEYADEVEAWLKPRYGSLPAMPGVQELFERLLEEKYPIAIATSSDREAMEKKLAPYPWIRNNVVTIVCGDDPHLKRGKPHPDIFLLTAERMGLGDADMSQIAVFEDSPSGVQGAVSAGMMAIAVPDKRLFRTEAAVKERFNHANCILREGLGGFTKELEDELFQRS